MICRSLALAIALLGASSSNAFSSGPGGCATPNPVDSLHLRTMDPLGPLGAGGFALTMGSVTLSDDGPNNFDPGEEYDISLTADPATPFRGFLIRLAVEGFDDTTSLISSGDVNASPASACGPIGSLGHNSGIEKSDISGKINWEDSVSTINLDVTVVVSNALESIYYISNFVLDVTDTATDPPTKSPVVPETDPPTKSPVVPATNPPTKSPVVPATDPPTKSPVVPATNPPTKSPVEPATNPPTKSPVVPGTQPPTKSPVVPATNPPTKSPVEPATQPPTTSPVAPTDRPTGSPVNPEPETNAPFFDPNRDAGPPTDPPTPFPTYSRSGKKSSSGKNSSSFFKKPGRSGKKKSSSGKKKSSSSFKIPGKKKV